MASVDNVRDSLISKLLGIKHQGLLSAIDKLISSSVKELKVDLTKEQIQMLKLSEDDIKNNRFISQEDLFERERQWLIGK